MVLRKARALAASIVFIFLITLTVYAQDKIDKIEDYFPMKKGYYWKYNMTFAGAKGPAMVYIVDDEVKIGKFKAFKICQYITEGSESHPAIIDYYAVTNDGICIVADGNILTGETKLRHEPSIYLKNSPEIGKEWVCVKFGNKIADKRKPAGIEEVVTPCGKFKALKIVVLKKTESGKELSETIWFAKGIGMVKMDAASTSGKVIIELAKHNIPKK